MEKHRQVSKESFNRLLNNINSWCDVNVGESTSHMATFSSMVNEIYASTEKEIITKDDITYGNYLCMNFSNEIECEKTKCPIEIVHLTHEENALNLVNRLLGRIDFEDHNLEILRTECDVSILKPGMTTTCICDLEQLTPIMTCEDRGKNPVLLTKDNVVILTDITQWINSESSLLILLKNIANYLGGSKILIIWEDQIIDPTFPEPMLTSEGFDVSILRHTSPITTLNDYDQIWLLNPGWCEHPIRKTTTYCSDFVDWKPSEIELIKHASESGKGIFLITDSGVIVGVEQNIKYTTFNRILRAVRVYFQQIPGCRCGCETTDYWSTDIRTHELTQGLNEFKVKAVAVLDCMLPI